MNSHITKAIRLVEHATEGLSEESLSGSVDGRWSPAQILEHLGRAYGGSAKVLEQSLAAGTMPSVRPLTMRDRIVIFVVCGIGYMPEERKAPQSTIPGDNPEGAIARKRAIENLERVGRVLEECEKKWGSSTLVFPHPILGPLTLPQFAKFHFVHTRHHMKQVRERAAQNLSRTTTA